MSTNTSQATLLRPSDPGYDGQVLERIKRRVKVDPVTECWLWQGFVEPTTKPANRNFHVGGYGKMGYRNRGWAVHRIVWTIVKGSVPAKMDVCHTCDVRHCCNPDHLWIGTRSQNIADMVAKGRGPFGKKAAQTHCIRGHELSGDNLYTTRNGKSRRCKTCMDAFHKLPHYKAKAAESQRRRRSKKYQEQRA